MDRFGLADVGALLIGLAVFVALGYLITYVASDGAKRHGASLRRLWRHRAEVAHFIMSRWPERADDAAGIEPVHVPVLDTGSTISTSAGAPVGTGAVSPDGRRPTEGDTDAANAGTDDWPPRLSLRLTDAETIALLALQRGKDGKHRYSANAIHALIGGSRAGVLAQVKVLRDGAPAVFRPLTPEQAQARVELGLEAADGRTS